MDSDLIQYYKLAQENRLPPLFVAARNGLPFCTYYLLTKCDVDVNEVCCGMTPLNCAIDGNHVTVVKILLSHSEIRLTREINAWNGPLHEAISCRDKSIFQLLLKRSRIDVNDTDENGINCFMVACLLGKISVLEALWNSSFKRKVKTDQKAKDTNRTSSHYACLRGHVPVVEFLLKHGLFQVNAVDCLGDTPLGSACREGQLNIVQLLLQEQVDIYVPEQCFYYASDFGYVHVMHMLLRYTSVPYHDLIKNIHTAVLNNNSQVAIVLMNELNKKDTKGLSNGDLEMISKFFKDNIWHPHAQIPRHLLSLWLNIHRHISNQYPTDKDENIVSDAMKTIKEMIISTYETSGIKLKCDIDLYVLYYAMMYGHNELVSHLLKGKSPEAIRHMINERVQGIKLKDLAIKHPSVSVLFHDKNSDSDKNKQSRSIVSWYKLKQFLSSDIYETDLKSHGLRTCNVVPYLASTCLAFNTYTELKNELKKVLELSRVTKRSTERHKVTVTIQSFMKAVGDEMKKENPEFSFIPIQVGSSTEETRPFFPDEFDFLLHCKQFQRLLTITKHKFYHNKMIIKMKSGCKYPYVPECTNEGDNTVDRFKTHMDHYLKKAIPRVFTNGKFMDHLYIDPDFFETKYISCIHLSWRGEEYKDMKIKIDLVPCFELSTFKPLVQYVDSPCKYYVFCKPLSYIVDDSDAPMKCPVAFSDIELKLVKQVSEAARNGHILTKAMRIKCLFPNEILNELQEVYNLEDCLKTYMIKMSLFICHKVNEKYIQDLSGDEWAYVLYSYLQVRIERRGSIPSIFEFNDRTEQTTLFLCEDPIDIAVKHQRKCCIQRKNLLLIATHLANLLRIHLCETERGNKINQLTEFAFKAANINHEELVMNW